MTRGAGAAVLAAILLCQGNAAQAAEKGLIIRAGKLMAQPFIDAADSGPVKPNQPVTILERKGGWASVESNGQKGWIRLLNVRLEPSSVGGSGKGIKGLKGLTTNSSGRTTTTGIKGLDDVDIKNATPNYVELDKLANLGVSASEGRSYGARSKLKEQQVQYLKKGGR